MKTFFTVTLVSGGIKWVNCARDGAVAERTKTTTPDFQKILASVIFTQLHDFRSALTALGPITLVWDGKAHF